MSLTTGIGKEAENGILIRSGEALQVASKLDSIVLDKTDTITLGKPSLTDVVVAGRFPDGDVLRLAAAVEKVSEHPLAAAIVEGADSRGIRLPQPEGFQAIPGHGVEAIVDGRKMVLGNLKMMEKMGVAVGELAADWTRLADEGKTPMYVAIDGQSAGIVAVADTIKEDSKQAIATLKRLGMEVAMMTGDNRRTADVTLIKGCLRGVATAIEISKATMRNVYQNLVGAFIYNSLGIPVALGILFPFFGILLSPLLAALAMSFSSVTVISNANRLKRFRPSVF
ncbi:MAG: HAD-IC family P-type ATPase [Dehalococcoidales bacterium]|nr:HAD-IC family P-type ATPase [Dehalococcoidales bacterium]